MVLHGTWTKAHVLSAELFTGMQMDSDVNPWTRIHYYNVFKVGKFFSKIKEQFYIGGCWGRHMKKSGIKHKENCLSGLVAAH